MKKTIFLTIGILSILVLTSCGGAEAPANEPANEPVYEYANQPVEEPAEEAYYAPSSSESSEVGSITFDEVSSSSWTDPEERETDDRGFVDTYYDHLSTFGIDVDTASYTQTRNYIKDGLIPPADSVRVEEFINFFDAGYEMPRDVAFGIFADGAPSPFERYDTQLIRIGIQGYEVPESRRKPVNLTFVIDVSGSMSSPDKLELVKDSLELLVDQLDREDMVSIVEYGSRAKTVLYPTSGNQKQTILRAIRKLRTNGSTNAEAGLRMGYQLAYEAFIEDGINRVILASDGVANVGHTEASELLRFIRKYADRGITLTTMGFGMGTFNDPFMEELADNGDGSYAYIDSMKESKRLFVDDLTSTLQVIAKDAKIQVDFNSEIVSHYRLLGYENRDIADKDFRNDEVDAGELGAGHSVTALYEVVLVGEEEGRIATIQFRWEDPDSGEVIEINGNFNTWDLKQEFSEADSHFQVAALAAYFAEILKESPSSYDIFLTDLLDYAMDLPRSVRNDADVKELLWLIEEADYLIGW